MDEILADYNELPFPLPQKHSWRSTFRFHIEDEQFRGLRLTRIAAHAVHIRWRFVKDFAGVNCLWATALQLSNDASFQHIHKEICVMSMWLGGLAGSEGDAFNHAFLARHIRKIFGHQTCHLSDLRIHAAKREHAAER